MKLFKNFESFKKLELTCIFINFIMMIIFGLICKKDGIMSKLYEMLDLIGYEEIIRYCKYIPNVIRFIAFINAIECISIGLMDWLNYIKE